MDLQILPEGLTEPTVSGAVFQRQAQLRWTQSLSRPWRLDVAVEDPTNRDVILNEPVSTPSRMPDLVGALQWDRPNRAHVRVTGLFRRLHVGETSSNGWALSTGAHVNLFGHDKLGVQGLASVPRGYLSARPQALKREVVGSPGPFSLLYTWKGRQPSLPPVVLMAHQDVVPVVPGTESQWQHDAYSGDIADGYIWGRGSLDDKIMIMAILEAIEMRLAAGRFRPRWVGGHLRRGGRVWRRPRAWTSSAVSRRTPVSCPSPSLEPFVVSLRNVRALPPVQ